MWTGEEKTVVRPRSMRKIPTLYGALGLTSLLILLSSCAGGPERVRPVESAVREPEKPSVAQQNLERAKWYVSHANPERDYRQALKEFELTFDLDPNIGRADYVSDWLSVLRELDRMTEEYDRMTEECKRVKQRLNQLTKENKELKESIEKIKNLDIKMEEKRKQIK